MSQIYNNLKSMDIKIPEPSLPLANYSPFIITNNLIFISGQIPVVNKKVIYSGKLGKELDIDTGKEAAKLCILNTFAILNKATNSNLTRIKKCIKISVFINSTDDFYEQPTVADGASNLITSLLSPSGEHSRAAISCNSLPKNSAVEIDSIFELFN